MRITLNLATRPFNDLGPVLRRLRIGMAVAAALCLLFLIGLHLLDRQASEARARVHSLDGDIARIQTERQQAQVFMQQPDNAQLLRQTAFLNERFDEKSFSWTLAMEALENVLPAGVQVTSIEPTRTKDGHITVELRVLGPHDLSVNLVRNLERSRRFLQPRIEGESAENANNLNQRPQPISASNRFEYELAADYNPPTAEERAALKNASLKAAPPARATPTPRPRQAAPKPNPSRPVPASPHPHGGAR